MSRLVLKNISQLVTVSGSAPKYGKDMDNIEIITNGCVIVDEDIITWVGSMEEYMDSVTNAIDTNELMNNSNHKNNLTEDIQIIDCSNKTVLPGFVDSHTHFVFGGYREDEYAMRLDGADYMDIMKAGGGIARSVKLTRETSFQDLLESGYQRLNDMLSMGVTSVEGKSGYGLNLETELKQLEVMKKLNEDHHIDVVSTFLGAHSVPEEYKDRSEEFIEYMVNEVLVEVVNKELAEFADIFCEKNVFNISESKFYLTMAKELGLKVKIHADEIANIGGSELAAELGATSADHLLVTSNEGIAALKKSATIATLLPMTAFSLKEDYAKARQMIDSGLALALATDFNPGSCFSHSIPLLIALAASQMHMSTKEIVCALTINGAAAIDKQDTIGSIEVGKKADLIMLKFPSIDFLPYHIGMNIVEVVIKKGNIVVDKREKKY